MKYDNNYSLRCLWKKEMYSMASRLPKRIDGSGEMFPRTWGGWTISKTFWLVHFKLSHICWASLPKTLLITHLESYSAHFQFTEANKTLVFLFPGLHRLHDLIASMQIWRGKAWEIMSHAVTVKQHQVDRKSDTNGGGAQPCVDQSPLSIKTNCLMLLCEQFDLLCTDRPIMSIF